MTDATAVELGVTVKDRITGFEGVVTGVVQYLTGCNQALVAPKVDEKGQAREAVWFDVQRLGVLPYVDRVILDNGPAPGADRPAPVR